MTRTPRADGDQASAAASGRRSSFAALEDDGGDAVPTAALDALYASSDDPWDLAGRWYERRKYALTLAALPRERYARALEVGCAVGLLSEQLAARCDELIAVDTAAAAVATARQRLRSAASATVERVAPPDDWPTGDFDLVVLSEVLYFTRGAVLDAFVTGAVARLRPEGHLVAVHYRPRTPVHRITGDEAHRRLGAQPSLQRLIHHVEDRFVLDVFEQDAASA